jgi:hypothetical protein
MMDSEITVRSLKNAELIQVAGGFDGISAFCILSAANIALGLYNTYQLQQTQGSIANIDSWLDYFYTKTLYNEAQLVSLPGYNETMNLSFEEADALVSQQYQ